MSNNSQVNKEHEKFEEWFHETQIENSLFPNVMKLFDTSKDILQEAYQAGANASSCTKLLTEQDYKYNKQTNELIARHAEQLEVAAEFCRQYQIEIARLKVDLYSEKEKNRVQFENSKLSMENIKNLLNEAYKDNSAKQRVIEELKYEIDGMTDENHTQRVLNNHLQFLLDSVMLEYCPDEMTEEQMENWKKAQRVVDTADPNYYESDTYKNNVKFSVDMIK